MRRGSSGSSSAAGGNKGALQCTVRLLDGSNILLEVNKKSNAQSTFDQVLRQLSIKGKEYFAFEFEDEQKHSQWVDLQKPLKKQIKKIPLKVDFRVKYYPLDPMIPHVSCRNHFYQQLRKDMIEGLLRCPVQTAPCIIAYILQADLGDYETIDKDMEYITDQKLLMHESTNLHEEIARFHQLYRGMNVMEAVNEFLRKVRELDTYGIQLFDMRYEDSACQLGISPGGISIFRRNRRILFHDWSVVAEVSFRSKKFIIVLTENGSEFVVSVEMESLKVCKDVWKISADFASFYSEPGRRVREASESSHNSGPLSPGLTPDEILPQPVTSHRPPEEGEGQEETLPSKPIPPHPHRSLLHNLPGGVDPIAAALLRNRNEMRNLSSTPTSPTDFTSLSSSMSDRHMSPLTPVSPVFDSNEMDIMLPGMPNLRDEEGFPLNCPQQKRPSPRGQAEKEKYREHREHIREPGSGRTEQRHMRRNDFPGDGMEPGHREFQGQGGMERGRHSDEVFAAHGHTQHGGFPEDRHVQRNGFSGQSQAFRQAGKRPDFPHSHGTSGPPSEEAPPPLPPPRNYGSHYRSDFHHTKPGGQSPAVSRQNQIDPAASSRHSLSDHGGTSNASNSRTNLSQDMDGSLLDLADELGGRTSSASLHSSSGRRSQTDLSVPYGYQKDPPNGKYSPHRNSRTLPSIFRKQHSNEATPSDRSPHSSNFGPSDSGSPVPGASPNLAAAGSGREREKSGRGVVRTWVQEQQLQSYQHSSTSQYSLNSSNSPEHPHHPQHSPRGSHSHPSPDFKTLHHPQPSPQHSRRSSHSHPSPPELKSSQASSRSSSSLPRGSFSSSSLRERDLEQDRLRSLSMESKGVLNLREQDFSSKGGSRVYRQFREMIAEEELPKAQSYDNRREQWHNHHQQRSHDQKSLDQQRSHDQSHHRSHDQRSLDKRSHDDSSLDNQRSSLDQQRSHNQRLLDEWSYGRRSPDYAEIPEILPKQEDSRRTHDHQHAQTQQELSHGSDQRSHDNHPGSRGHTQSSHDARQGPHDCNQADRLRSHDGSRDYNPRSHDNTRQPGAYNQPPPPPQVEENIDFPLPSSPAPPPYKSPSPDSEQAQVLQQLEHQSHRRMQFVYHASSLGMGTEQFTDMSMANATAGSGMEGVNRPTPKMQRHQRSRSPRVQSQNKGNPAVTVIAGQTGSAAGQTGSAAGQTGSAAGQTDSAAGQTGSAASQSGSTAAQTGFVTFQTASAASKTASEMGQPGFTGFTADRNGSIVAQTSSTAGQTGSTVGQGGSPALEDAAGASPPGALDIFKEIDELMGGVEAMVSEAKIGADAMVKRRHEVDKGGREEDKEQSVSIHEIERTSEPEWVAAPDVEVTIDTSFPTNLPPPVEFDHAHAYLPPSTLTPDRVRPHAVSAASLGSSPTVSRGSLEVVTPPSGFSGGEDEEEEGEGRVRGPGNEVGRPEVEIRGLPEAAVEIQIEGPVIDHSSDPSTSQSAGRLEGDLPVLESAEQRAYSEDNLAGILQEVMTADNLPPPPAHLMALSQELQSQDFQSYSQDPSGDVDGVRVSSSPRVVPSIATTSRTSADSAQQQLKERTPVAKKEPQVTKYDAKLFSHKKVELPLPSSYENVTLQTTGTAHLPPEIANFMNRVRNFSVDGSDGHAHQLSESSELSAGKGGGSDGGKFPTRRVGGLESASFSGSNDLGGPTEKEKNAQFHTEHDSLDPHSASANYRQDTGSISPKSPRPLDLHLEHGSQVQQHIADEKSAGKELKRQVGEGNLAASAVRDPHEVSAHQPTPTKTQSKAFSLPRGHVGDFHRHFPPHANEDASSHGSSPTAPQAHSDVVAPMYPGRQVDERSSFREQQRWDDKAVLDEPGRKWEYIGHRDGRGVAEEHLGDRVFTDEQQRQEASKRRGDKVLEVQVRKRDNKEAWTFKGAADERGNGRGESQRQAPEGRTSRAHTFSSSEHHHRHHPQQQGQQQGQQPAHSGLPQSGGGPDSLPNSPTYFSQLPLEDRVTPSPNTQMANQSFQGHLDSLDEETKMRKKKVMDWIQKTSIQSWERENTVKSDKDPRKLQLDPGSHLPVQPYLKQEPIYATADDIDTVPEPDGARKQTYDSLPSENRVPEWRAGATDQRYRAEPRQRGATVSGSKMEHYPTRQYPTPSWQSAAAQGRGGREAGQGVQGSGVRGYAGQGAQGRGGREVQGSAGLGAHGRGGRGIQLGPAGQESQGRWVREVRGSSGQEGQRRGRGEIQGPAGQGAWGYSAQGVQRREGREIQGDRVHGSSAGEPNLSASYPTARFEKDYYVLDV